MSTRVESVRRLREAATMLTLVDVPAPKGITLYPGGGLGFSWDVADEDAAVVLRDALTRWNLRWSTYRYDAPDRNADVILSGWDYDSDRDIAVVIAVPVPGPMAVAS